jgi:hypothetical protein
MKKQIKRRKRLIATRRSVELYEDEQSFDRFKRLTASVLAVPKREVQDLERKRKTRKEDIP